VFDSKVINSVSLTFVQIEAALAVSGLFPLHSDFNIIQTPKIGKHYVSLNLGV
jgi:hypothetical protein